jgi:integrase/recombinase XerC
MNELLPPQITEPLSLIEAFFASKSKVTLRAYDRDLRDFQDFIQAPSLEAAAKRFLSVGQGPANALALSYKAHLLRENLAPATINRRLAALRSLVALGRVVGVCSFSLEVDPLKVQALRDTRGPGHEGVKKMLSLLVSRTDKKARRDYALLRLMFDLALRRGEVVSLDVEHLELASGGLWVLGKGRTQRQRLTLPTATQDALRAWMKERGESDGSLFYALDPCAYGKRLTGEGIRRVVKKLGTAAGIKVRPHGLRHASITRALDVTRDLRKVQRFSRHQSLEMLKIYDDAREDFAGEVAVLVAQD